VDRQDELHGEILDWYISVLKTDQGAIRISFTSFWLFLAPLTSLFLLASRGKIAFEGVGVWKYIDLTIDSHIISSSYHLYVFTIVSQCSDKSPHVTEAMS
jgi:hypothetical protein